jgi:CIC family chloride channel protein
MKSESLFVRPRLQEIHILLVLAALIGLLGALVTVAFRMAIRGIEWVFTGHSSGLVEAAESLLWWQRLIVPGIGGLLAGVILQLGLRLVRGRTTSDYMEAVAVGDGVLGVRTSLVKSASSLVTIGSGGSIGREGSMVQLAALVGSVTGRLLPHSESRMRLLVACGAAAGLASAYNAPIAGALFVAEIVLGSIAMESLGPMIVSSVVASATVRTLLGFGPVFAIPPLRFVSEWETFFYLALGLVCGVTAPLFLFVLTEVEKGFSRLRLPLFAKLALGGLTVGALSTVRPEIWGNGYSVVTAILHSRLSWQIVAAVLVFKVVATAATAGSGATGGVFTPTIFVGASLGFLLGSGVHAMFPGVTAGPDTYAVIGMGAFLAATTQAPVMSILMIFEMTLDYEIVLPLMLGCVMAYYVSRTHLNSESIYARSMRSKEADRLAGRLAGAAVRDFVEIGVPTVPAGADLSTLIDRMRTCREARVLVVDDAGGVVGVLPVESLATALAEQEKPGNRRAGDLVSRDYPFLTPDLSLGAAFLVFARSGVDWLPVIAGASDRRLLGRLHKCVIFQALADDWRQGRETPGS